MLLALALLHACITMWASLGPLRVLFVLNFDVLPFTPLPLNSDDVNKQAESMHSFTSSPRCDLQTFISPNDHSAIFTASGAGDYHCPIR
jgi:hypothetical protein